MGGVAPAGYAAALYTRAVSPLYLFEGQSLRTAACSVASDNAPSGDIVRLVSTLVIAVTTFHFLAAWRTATEEATRYKPVHGAAQF